MESSSSNKNKTDVAHNSLADIPINAVLIGVFAEALKNLGHLKEKHEYPEFITIPNSSASDEAGTFDNTYKFKSVDVRNYLEQLSHVIELMLNDFNFRGNSDGIYTSSKIQKSTSESSSPVGTQKSRSTNNQTISDLDEQLDTQPENSTNSNNNSLVFNKSKSKSASSYKSKSVSKSKSTNDSKSKSSSDLDPDTFTTNLESEPDMSTGTKLETLDASKVLDAGGKMDESYTDKLVSQSNDDLGVNSSKKSSNKLSNSDIITQDNSQVGGTPLRRKNNTRKRITHRNI